MVLSALGLLALLPSVFAIQQNFTFDLVNKVIAPDGFERSAVTVNGIFPSVIYPLCYQFIQLTLVSIFAVVPVSTYFASRDNLVTESV